MPLQNYYTSITSFEQTAYSSIYIQSIHDFYHSLIIYGDRSMHTPKYVKLWYHSLPDMHLTMKKIMSTSDAMAAFVPGNPY